MTLTEHTHIPDEAQKIIHALQTELEHAEKALHESEQRFTQLIENSHAGYFRVGTSGLYEDVNQAYASMYGYETPFEMIGLPFNITQIDIDLDDLFTLASSVIQGEFSRRNKNGAIGYNTFFATPLFAGGTLVAVEGFQVDLTDRRRAEKDREELIGKLQAALSNIKTLKGLIPICASCKNIRDDQGYWHQVEVYVLQHSDASFSHSLCPNCVAKLYPDLVPNSGTLSADDSSSLQENKLNP